MSWYKAGTVTVTNNSPSVIGAGTTWSNGAVASGAAFSLIDTSGAAIAPFYEVLSVTDDTHITLKTPYGGMTVTGAQYALWNLAGEQTTPYLAAAVSELVRKCKNVEQNASTASDDAQRAETARSAAETARDTAVAAKTAAETAAQNAAVSETAAQRAQAGAGTAQTGAETARTGAETARASAERAEGAAEAARDAASVSEANAQRTYFNVAQLALQLGNPLLALENQNTLAEAILQENLLINNIYDRLEGGMYAAI